MVKILKIIFIVFFSTISLLSVKSQTRDSFVCNKYLEWLESEDAQLITLWSQAPQLKETSMPLLCRLCNLSVCDSCKRMIVTLILDKNGHVMCLKTYPELVQNSLNNEIINLLYKLEFNPAMQYKTPVISHFGLIVDAKRCDFCRNINAEKKKRRKIFTAGAVLQTVPQQN